MHELLREAKSQVLNTTRPGMHCRALAAANPAVRRNALQLLVDAFPLHDPEATQVLGRATDQVMWACMPGIARDTSTLATSPTIRVLLACLGLLMMQFVMCRKRQMTC